MKKIRWSRYAILTKKDNGDVVAFQSKTREINYISKETVEQIERYIEEPFRCSGELEDVIVGLVHAEFLVTEDEKEERKFDEYRTEYYGKFFGTAIYFMPTLDCNFKCTYCIQKMFLQGNRSMSDDVLEKTVNWVVEFVKNSIANDEKGTSLLRPLNIVLFGGEPTLENEKNIVFIDELKKRLSDKVDVNFQMITNGYEISEEEITRYRERGIKSIQITLDGPPEIHDKRRMNLKNEPTFKKIMQTIKECNGKGIHVVVRINVDNENANYVCELIDILGNEISNKKKVSISVAPVDDNDGQGEGGHVEYALSKFDEIYKKISEYGFEYGLWECFCGVYANNFFAIAPDGLLYKCPSALERKYIVGKVSENGFNTSYEEIINTKIEEGCLKCKYVGLCGGGCFNQNAKLGRRKCLYKTFEYLVPAYCKSIKGV